ncbi:MAG TPA: erythromycin esterase family protein, partial [Gemmatimonadaceae bacterium]|nr:erythromycin esterase family protein [Gemmatimonadaceae bacterium]
DLAAAWSIQGIPPEPDSSVRVWQASTDRVRQHVRGRQAAYLARAQSAADSAEVTWALQNAELIYQSASFGDESPSAVRDSAMAANIAWAMSQRPGARGVIWAHNFHVSRQPGTMGSFLERMLPGEVKIFALTGAQGEYTAASSFSSSYAARQYEAFPIMPASPPAGSVASVLVQGGWPVAVVDLREAPTSPAAAWLREPRPFLSVGGMAMDYSYSLEALPGAYDFLLFVRSTTPSRGLQ